MEVSNHLAHSIGSGLRETTCPLFSALVALEAAEQRQAGALGADTAQLGFSQGTKAQGSSQQPLTHTSLPKAPVLSWGGSWATGRWCCHVERKGGLLVKEASA